MANKKISELPLKSNPGVNDIVPIVDTSSQPFQTKRATVGSLSLVGPTGAAGPTGVTGATGPAGSSGVSGATGPQGATGVAGNAGSDGATGATGATGAAGSAGATGATGPQGDPATNLVSSVNGQTGAVSVTTWEIPQFTPSDGGLNNFTQAVAFKHYVIRKISTTSGGAVLNYTFNDPENPNAGDYYVVYFVEAANSYTIGGTSIWSAGTRVVRLYKPGIGGGWSNIVLSPSTGPTGPQGATGVQGAIGPQGATGATGPQGATGPANTAATYAVSAQAPSASQNNLDVSGAPVVRLSPSAAVSITGLLAGTDGQVKIVYNASSFNVTLSHNSASSSVGNRFFAYNAADYVLAANCGVTITYDSTSGYWRVF